MVSDSREIELMLEYTWMLDPLNPMVMLIKHNGVVKMRIFLGEAMESAGKTAVMKHVNICNNSPWVKSWHDEVWNILKNE